MARIKTAIPIKTKAEIDQTRAGPMARNEFIDGRSAIETNVGMADDAPANNIEHETSIRGGLDVIQSMIDISTKRLERLRTQCATSAALTQQEIRLLETKLVKIFSELLITNAKLSGRLCIGLPATGAVLRQWLHVVGLSPNSVNVVMQRISTLELLLNKSDIELSAILDSNVHIREEEVRRLNRAMANLKRCRDAIVAGDKVPNELFWDSWDRHNHINHRVSATMARNQQHLLDNANNEIQMPDELTITERQLILPKKSSISTITPLPTPFNSPSEPSPANYNDIVASTNHLSRGIGHEIAHRFTKKFAVMSTCNLCNKQMFFGLKCKECKYRCHEDCESNVPPSCGLPPVFIKKGLNKSLSNASPNMGDGGGIMGGGFHLSSEPPTKTGVLHESNSITLETTHIKLGKGKLLSDTHSSNVNDEIVSLSGSTSAMMDSDRSPIHHDPLDEHDVSDWTQQNSISLEEWDIPYSDLNLLERIGHGCFGTVHRGHWHGDVAVKLLRDNHLDDERKLEAFKLEVATFKKTRHENLVLFMGVCMQPQAIITSLCKGNTLYTHIHLHEDQFSLSRTIVVAQQIAQGMGYLHARKIVHKNLTTRNVFLENGKVIITDFGLFSASKLQYCEYGVSIPSDGLSYLAPELIRRLQPVRPRREDELPFSKASDVYAFGCVWYELLCGEFPFERQPAEAVIFQVGRGMKQTLANLQASHNFKDILMRCWSYQSDDRPDFAKLLILLECLPNKRLARRPPQPMQLSRLAELVF